MDADIGLGLFALLLVCGATYFGIRAFVALAEGRARLRRLDLDLVDARAERTDREAIRQRNESLLRTTGEQVAQLTAQLETARAELEEAKARKPVRIHLLSRKVEPSWPLYMAPVDAATGFESEPGGRADSRIYAGPAPDEAAFREELSARFPAAGGFTVGSVTLFMPSETALAARRAVA
ncbi:hypothetical protein [Rhodocista pekingensis]|uniref:Uncharacterized protein n=1 Tax=Rhodocista pekingensis TaxID=201185 RepID=A0ABW2KS84_9PROT